MSPRSNLLSMDVSKVDLWLQDTLKSLANNECGAMFQEHLDTGGKKIRAKITLQMGQALGLSERQTLPWAAAVEVLHNATLIHDDIQDGDEVRRSQPTTWAKYGIPQAINVGDLGLMLPFAMLQQIPTSDAHRWALSQCLSQHAIATVCGQSFEMNLLSSLQLDMDSYLQAVRGKTGAFFALPIEGLTILADWNEVDRQEIASVFTQLGTLFQIQDDILDCFGNKGRQLGADLCEGKVSILVVHHLRSAPEQSLKMIQTLRTAREEIAQTTVADIIADFQSSGALQASLTDIQALYAEITSAPILQSHPGLLQIVDALIDRMLTPIQHLFQD